METHPLDPKLLRRMARFAGIPTEAQAHMLRHGIVRHFAKGQPIFFEGDACTHFYMVLKGEVTVFKVLETGRDMILDIMRSGEAFGEVALLDGTALPASATARTDARVVMLPRRDYLLLLERYPQVAQAIIRDLHLRMRSLRQRVELLSEGGVQARIALLLLSYARELGREEEGGTLVPVRLSRQEISGMVCARVETVIRIMSRWQKEGLVETVPEGFLIADRQALEAITAGEG